MARAIRVNWQVWFWCMEWGLFWDFMALSLKYGTFLLRWLAAVYEEIDRIFVKQSGGGQIVDSHFFFGKAGHFGTAAVDLLAAIGMRCG